jgi:hypothetical protein
VPTSAVRKLDSKIPDGLEEDEIAQYIKVIKSNLQAHGFNIKLIN